MKLGTIGSILALFLLSLIMLHQQSGYLAIFSALMFMVTFAISWGAGCWVLISEIFPPPIKSYAMGLAVSGMWVFNFLVTLFFPVLNEIPALQQAFHGAFSFWIFAAINLFCFLFLIRHVPETRGVVLDDIEQLLADHIKHGYDAARVIVVAETTRAYVDACTYGESIGIARSSIGLAHHSFDLISKPARRPNWMWSGPAARWLRSRRPYHRCKANGMPPCSNWRP
ncbi:TPA: MFS transporter [Raoultella ornithinolytica]